MELTIGADTAASVAIATDMLSTDNPLWVIVAWLWDRREQYKPESGTYAAFDELIVHADTKPQTFVCDSTGDRRAPGGRGAP